MTALKVGILALIVPLFMGMGPMRQYYVGEAEGDYWYIAPQEGPVMGTQNGWFVAPADLLPGRFGLVGRVLSVDASSIEFRHTNCVRGTVRLPFHARGGRVGHGREERKAPAQPLHLHRAGEVGRPGRGGGDGREHRGRDERRSSSRRSPSRRTSSSQTGRCPCAWRSSSLKDKPGLPQPDVRGLRYGPHWKHGIDIYYPKDRGTSPLPVIVDIHGGGWGANDKASVAREATQWMQAGFAFAAVSYRYVSMAKEYPATDPPVAASLLDAARAVQFLRYKAGELGIDPKRFGFTGGSAGAATSLWLALHDDMADPDSADPVARMSTRPQCVVAVQPQTSLDPVQMRKWIPPITYGPHAFFPSSAGTAPRDREQAFEFWLSKRDQIMPWIKEFSPAEHVSADDPPILLNYLGRTMELPGNPTHHPLFGKHLYDMLQAAGVESYFVYGDQDPEEKYGTWAGVRQFFVDHLKPGGHEDD